MPLAVSHFVRFTLVAEPLQGLVNLETTILGAVHPWVGQQLCGVAAGAAYIVVFFAVILAFGDVFTSRTIYGGE